MSIRPAHPALSLTAEEWHPDPVGGGRRPDIMKVRHVGGE
jgi:hypothetical protein